MYRNYKCHIILFIVSLQYVSCCLLCSDPSFSSNCPAKEKTPIKITLRDGKVVDGEAWKTTPYDVAVSIRCFVLESS